LFLVPVDFFDGVVDIDEGEVIDPGHDRCGASEVQEPPPGHGVELTDVTERECPKERTQR
jgi:hypothetical protein